MKTITPRASVLQMLEALKTARLAVYELTRSALINSPKGISRAAAGVLAWNNPVIVEIDAAIVCVEPDCAEVKHTAALREKNNGWLPAATKSNS